MFFCFLSESGFSSVFFFPPERVARVNVIKLIKLTQENAFSPPPTDQRGCVGCAAALRARLSHCVATFYVTTNTFDGFSGVSGLVVLRYVYL